MHYRSFGRTGWQVSEVSFGAWAIGASWGAVDDNESLAALHRAVDCGVNFLDTADVYGMGRSERLIARLRRERNEPLIVATKAGRRLDPHTAEGYNARNLERFIDDSRRHLEMDRLDLVQLHCPPSVVYTWPWVFEALEMLREKGKIAYYGVSVETVNEALKAIEHPGVVSVQIIFNLFRLKPAERFFAAAQERNIAVIARVPLASGLLTGRITRDTTFAPDDHRNFNRHGEAFDVGETFSGVDFETALAAVEELKIIAGGRPLAEFALRWILMHDAVSCAIPGAKRPAQVEENCRASDAPPLTEAQMAAVRALYDAHFRARIHGRW